MPSLSREFAESRMRVVAEPGRHWWGKGGHRVVRAGFSSVANVMYDVPIPKIKIKGWELQIPFTVGALINVCMAAANMATTIERLSDANGPIPNPHLSLDKKQREKEMNEWIDTLRNVQEIGRDKLERLVFLFGGAVGFIAGSEYEFLRDRRTRAVRR